MGPDRLYESLGDLHNFDTLEEVLDFSARSVVASTQWSTVLLTFYVDDEAHFGTAGCPRGTKARFHRSFLLSSPEGRDQKRQALLRFVQPGTNVCFVPDGNEPRPSAAFIKSPPGRGSWKPGDRLVIFIRDWENGIIGVLSLDNPQSGNRPNPEELRRLRMVDRFINVVGRIVENRFLSKRLEESERAYRSVFESVADGLLIISPDGIVIAANPAVAEMHGRSTSEIIGQPVKILVSPDSYGKLDTVLEAARTDQPVDLEGRSIRADGTPFDVEVRGGTFTYRGESRFLATVRDVTERNRMMFQLLESQKEESLVAMAGGIAHDFNNALMGITGSLGLLDLDSAPDHPHFEHCNRIRESAKRLRGLTAQLLSVAQGTHSEPKPFDLFGLVDESLGPIHGMAGQAISVKAEVDAPAPSVEADMVQLRQVILGLALNSCEAMADGGTLRIRVGTELRDQPFTCSRTGAHPPGAYAVLKVQDDGEGMDESTIRRLFEPYYSRRGANRGLGMVAILGIIKRHRGAIAITSIPGEGTIIEVRLPACEQMPEAPLVSPDTPLPEGRTVLLVDDEPVVREVAGEMLKELGWNIICAGSGAEALQVYDAHRDEVDLVLLDQQMPGLTGTEVSRALWQRDPEVRILLSSGHSEEFVREDLESGGSIAGFLQKPYSVMELSMALQLACAQV